MDFETSRHADVCIATAAGRVDHTTANAFQEALLKTLDEADMSTLVLDLSGVEYMSSVGLRALMVASKTAKPAGIAIVVASLTGTLAEIFQISRFDMVFKTYASVREAIAEASPEALASFES